MLRPEDCFFGNEVICINLPVLLGNERVSADKCPLKLGNIYTIEEYFPAGTFRLSPSLDGVSLLELYNGDVENTYGWSTKLFRPIDTKYKVFYDILKSPLDPVLLEEEFQEDKEMEEYLIQAL